jgi:hypothetical protein
VPGRGQTVPGQDPRAHAAFDAVAEWMVRAIAGLEVEDAHPDSGAVSLTAGPDGAPRSSAAGPAAWSRIRFAPRVTGGLTHTSAEHRAATGLVRSAWKLAGDELVYECTVPPGAFATLDLPAADADSIVLDGQPLRETKELVARAAGAGVVRIELASGSYVFRARTR